MQSRSTSANARSCSHRSCAARDHSASSARHAARTAPGGRAVVAVGHDAVFEQIVRANAGEPGPARAVVTSVVRMRSPAVRRLRIAVVVAAVLGAGLLVAAAGGSARAQVSITSDTAPPSTAKPTTDKAGVQHLHFEYGPLEIRPGQNVIDTNKYLIPQPERGRLDRRVQAQPAVAERQGAAGRRDPPAPRRVGERVGPRRHRIRCSPSASSPPARRRPRSSCPPGYGYRVPPDRRLVPQLHDPRPHAEAVHGVPHLRRRLRARDVTDSRTT